MNLYMEKHERPEDTKMQKAKTIFLWGQDGIHIIAVEALLKKQREWEVIRISNQLSKERLRRRMKEEETCVVILFEEDCENVNKLASRLLIDQPDLRVITLSTHNNIAEIYGRQSVIVEEVADFLSLIDSG